jgi:hypothetical protein
MGQRIDLATQPPLARALPQEIRRPVLTALDSKHDRPHHERAFQNSTQSRLCPPSRSSSHELGPAIRSAVGSHSVDRAARILCRRAELPFDAQQLIVFRDAVGPARGACLDLSRASGHSEIGDERIFRLA